MAKNSDLHIPIETELQRAFITTCNNLGFEKTKIITGLVMYMCQNQSMPRELVPYVYYLEVRGRRSRRSYVRKGRSK